MIKKEDFDECKRILVTFDEEREKLITTSRKLQSLAKQGMYHVHKHDVTKAESVFSEADPLVKELLAAYHDDHKRKIGAVTAALQEWCECYAFLHYVKTGDLIIRSETGLEVEDYLLGVADLTGELVRKAVTHSIHKERDAVMKIKVFVEELYGLFLECHFRNGELRKKTDAIRWNLQKIEELLL